MAGFDSQSNLIDYALPSDCLTAEYSKETHDHHGIDTNVAVVARLGSESAGTISSRWSLGTLQLLEQTFPSRGQVPLSRSPGSVPLYEQVRAEHADWLECEAWNAEDELNAYLPRLTTEDVLQRIHAMSLNGGNGAHGRGDMDTEGPDGGSAPGNQGHGAAAPAGGAAGASPGSAAPPAASPAPATIAPEVMLAIQQAVVMGMQAMRPGTPPQPVLSLEEQQRFQEASRLRLERLHRTGLEHRQALDDTVEFLRSDPGLAATLANSLDPSLSKALTLAMEKAGLGNDGPVRCHNCQQLGHYQRDCPLPRKRRHDEDDSDKQQRNKGSQQGKRSKGYQGGGRGGGRAQTYV